MQLYTCYCSDGGALFMRRESKRWPVSSSVQQEGAAGNSAALSSRASCAINRRDVHLS